MEERKCQGCGEEEKEREHRKLESILTLLQTAEDGIRLSRNEQLAERANSIREFQLRLDMLWLLLVHYQRQIMRR